MQVTQRGLLVIAVIVIFIQGWFVVSSNKAQQLQNQLEKVQTERFLLQLGRNGLLSLEEYEQYHARLNYGGVSSGIRIDVYREEKDLEGNRYYYLMPWEELGYSLFEEGKCSFPYGSVIVVEIERSCRGRSVCNRYYEIISGKGQEDAA